MKILFVLMGPLIGLSIAMNGYAKDESHIVQQVAQHREDEGYLARLFPTVKCSFLSTKYEQILMSQLRDQATHTAQFRDVSTKLTEILVGKVIECLPTHAIEVTTPVRACPGLALSSSIELVSVMRSGSAMLDVFMRHFPQASVSKVLIQRDETTAEPYFKYMKLSPQLMSGNRVVITEPMIATGGTLEMAITILKEQGISEDHLIVASFCAAPEGLLHLSKKFPGIQIVFIALDERLNETKYIVPGLGDFGDRFFGTH